MFEISNFFSEIIYYIKMPAFIWRDITGALIIFVLFLLIRKIFVRYIFRTIKRLSKKTKTKLDTNIIEAFENPLRALIIVLGVFFALRYLPLTPDQNFIVVKLFRGSLIAFLAWGFYNLTGTFWLTEIGSRFDFEIDQILVPFLTKIIHFMIVVLAVSMIAQEWGFNVSGFVAGLGLGGLAIALAAKDALANIFGGVVIITDKPFSIGDWIDTPSVEGTVEDISFRSTKVRTFANALVTVPNATLANESITNWTRMGKRRVTFHLGVTYTTPREKLQSCVEEIRKMLEEHPEIHKETIFARFDKFNESSLDIFLYFFTNTTKWGEYLEVKEDVNFKIMEILENEGVSMAFPSRSIYLETPLNFDR